MARHEYVHRARMNGRGSRQYADIVRVNVDRLVRWLDLSCSRGRHPAVRRKAHALLEWMADNSWRISAGPHRGGRGDSRGVDRTLHITVYIEGVSGSFHLKMDARGHLFDITGRGLPQLPPWTSL
jgi:hypothetical protein